MDLSDLTGQIPPAQLQELEDTPFYVTYTFPAIDIGAGNVANVLASPAGFRGKVRNISVYDVTEAFTATTLAAHVDVGVSGDLDAFCVSASLGTTGIAASICPALTDGATHIIQPGTSIYVTAYAPTGGVPAGIATVAVTIQYFK